MVTVAPDPLGMGEAGVAAAVTAAQGFERST
jgi:hypothetical protein